LENEIAKVKISIPFNELLKNFEYRAHIGRILKDKEGVDSLNLQDDHPTIMFDPKIEYINDTEDVPPFYISLGIRNLYLHNAMLDFGSSHNPMPKFIMDNLGLDITRPYKDLFSFDSHKFKCIVL
jgi:hypothetical protein